MIFSSNGDKISIAVVGLGFGRYIASEILSGAANKYFNLAAVCDLDKKLVTDFSKEFSIYGTTCLDELLRNPDIQSIGVFTGPAGRADLIRKIIDAGKDVMTTKPFEVDANKAIEIFNYAQEVGRVIHLNSPLPSPSIEEKVISDWREHHDLGRPISARYATWCDYNEKPDGSWYDDPLQCPAAPLLRLGIYALNEILPFFDRPAAVHVMQSRIKTGRPTADNAQLSIKFESGALVHIYCAFCIGGGTPYPNSLVFNFERGTIYRNAGPDAIISNHTHELTLVTTGNGRQIVDKKTISPPDYRWDLFYQEVKGVQIQETVPVDIIIDSINILHAMKLSASKGEEVPVADIRNSGRETTSKKILSTYEL